MGNKIINKFRGEVMEKVLIVVGLAEAYGGEIPTNKNLHVDMKEAA